MWLTKPDRVGYVLKRYPRYSETFIVNEILAHEAAGQNIEIFSLRHPEDTHFQDSISQVRAPVTYLWADGLKVLEFWSALKESSEVLPGIWTALEAARGTEAREVYQAVVLAREVRLRGIDHLHAHFATSATTVARLAARFAGIPYTFTAHAKDIFHESVCHDDMRRLLDDAASVITVSDYNVEYLSRIYGADAARIVRVYNGLNLNRFSFQPPQDRAPQILAIGRLVEKKGFSYLIDACAVLASRGISFHCEIIGTGELEADLRARIAEMGVGNRVELAGPRPQSEVIERLRKASVLVAPCVIGSDGNRDGLPTVLLESMALGTPCISTDVTGIPEVIHDEETGLLVSQQDSTALATAIQRLLTDPALRVRLASRARRLIEERFDVSGNAAELRGLFQAAQNSVKRTDRSHDGVISMTASPLEVAQEVC